MHLPYGLVKDKIYEDIKLEGDKKYKNLNSFVNKGYK
jgi:hypothetical protein